MAEPQGAPPASAASGVNRLRGHLGHLTQEESAALGNFKNLAAEAGFYRASALDKKTSHDDGTLVYVIDIVSTPESSNSRGFILVGILEQGNSFRKTHSSNSKTRRSGGKITTWKRSMR